MPRNRIEATHFSPDTRDFIRLLHQHSVRYVIVGGEAVIYYGYARLTGDVDFFYDIQADNAALLFEALLAFWDGDIPGISEAAELMVPGLILQFGLPPNRIDLLNQIAGVSFETAWPTRLEILLVSDHETTPMYYIGLAQLIENKAAAGRPKDLDDLSYLRNVARSDADPE